MGRVEYLKSQRTEDSAVYLQFILVYKRKGKDLYLFFEGRDDLDYFMPKVRRYSKRGTNLYPIECHGKSGVINAYNIVKTKVNNIRRTLFFVDKDFDDFLKIELPRCKSIYSTKFYSIENYIVNNEMVSIIWAEHYFMEIQDKRLRDIQSMFDIGYREFQRHIKRLMAWAVCQRLRGRNFKFSDIKIDDIYTIASGAKFICHCRNKVCYLQTATGLSPVTLGEMRKCYELFQTSNPKGYIRGKYELWFLVKFFSYINAAINRNTDGLGGKKTKAKMQLNTNSAITLLGDKLPCDIDLEKFLIYNISRT